VKRNIFIIIKEETDFSVRCFAISKEEHYGSRRAL
jgi:hypothetical protein